MPKFAWLLFSKLHVISKISRQMKDFALSTRSKSYSNISLYYPYYVDNFIEFILQYTNFIEFEFSERLMLRFFFKLCQHAQFRQNVLTSIYKAFSSFGCRELRSQKKFDIWSKSNEPIVFNSHKIMNILINKEGNWI